MTPSSRAKVSGDQEQRVIDDLIARRFRSGLAVLGGTFVLLTLLRGIGHGLPASLALVKLGQVAIMAIGLYLLRPHAVPHRQVQLRAMLIVVAVFASLAIEGAIQQTAAGTAALSILIVLGAAILLPWTVRSQILVAAMAAAAILFDLLWLETTNVGNRDPLMASLMALVISVFVVHQLGRQRAVADHARLALQQEAMRFRALIQNSNDLVAVIDGESRVQYVGPSIRHILGFEPDEVIGRSAVDFIHEEDLAAVRAIFSEALRRSGSGRVVQARTRRAQGDWIWLEWATRNRIDDPPIHGIVANARDVTLRKQVESELRRSSEQLRALSEQLRTIREDESTRIAREIHDELGQSLTGLKLDLGWLQRQLTRADATVDARPIQDKIRSLSASVDGILETVRRIASELRPGLLDTLGLSAAVEWQTSEFERRTGVRARVSIVPRDLKVDAARSTATFRILQEILTNVVRHAEAKSVIVTLTLQAEALTLDVSDDGKGIPPEALSDPRALGLLGIRERALAVGGRVEILGRPGRGTRVRVEIPLQRADPGRTSDGY